MKYSAPMPGRSAWTLCVLFALIGCAGWARFSSIGSRLPHAPSNDEHVYIWQMDLFGSAEDPRRDPSYGFYPHLISRIASVWPTSAPTSPKTLDEHLAVAGADFVRARSVVALLSLLALPATWLVARRFLKPGFALLAVGFVATSVLTTWYATEARPHAAVASFMVCSVAAALAIRERGKAWTYLLGGLITGLALATLQSGALCFVPLVVAHIARPREQRPRERAWLALAIVVAVLVAWPFYPFLFATPEKIGNGPPQGATVFFGHDLWLRGFDGSGFRRLLSALWQYETLPFLLALLGLCASLPRSSRRIERPRVELVIALSLCLPYLLLFGLYYNTYARFALPLVPFLAIAAAAAVDRVASLFARPVLRALVFVIAAAGALAPCAALIRLRHAPDTAQLAARWIAAHVSMKETLAVLPSLDLPLARDPSGLGNKTSRVGERLSAWRTYERSHGAAIARLPTWDIEDLRVPFQDEGEWNGVQEFVDRAGARWFVLETYDRRILRDLVAWARLHARSSVRIATADAAVRDERAFLMHDGLYDELEFCWTLRLFSEDRLGSMIEIYHLDP